MVRLLLAQFTILVVLLCSGEIQCTCETEEWIIFNQHKTWKDANDYCERYGAQLLTMRNEHKLKALEAHWPDINLCKDVWLGLECRKSNLTCKWFDGSTIGHYSNWKNSSIVVRQIPNNYCVRVEVTNVTTWTWIPTDCSDSQTVVCEKTKAQGCGYTEYRGYTVSNVTNLGVIVGEFDTEEVCRQKCSNESGFQTRCKAFKRHGNLCTFYMTRSFYLHDETRRSAVGDGTNITVYLKNSTGGPVRYESYPNHVLTNVSYSEVDIMLIENVEMCKNHCSMETTCSAFVRNGKLCTFYYDVSDSYAVKSIAAFNTSLPETLFMKRCYTISYFQSIEAAHAQETSAETNGTGHVRLGKEFILFGLDRPWKFANRYCKNYGGRLLTIKSQTDLDMLKDIWSTATANNSIWKDHLCNDVWTGLRNIGGNSGNFAWSDDNSSLCDFQNVDASYAGVGEAYIAKTQASWQLQRQMEWNHHTVLCEKDIDSGCWIESLLNSTKLPDYVTNWMESVTCLDECKTKCLNFKQSLTLTDHLECWAFAFSHAQVYNNCIIYPMTTPGHLETAKINSTWHGIDLYMKRCHKASYFTSDEEAQRKQTEGTYRKGKSYVLFAQKRTRDNAQQYCKDISGNAITVKTKEALDILTAHWPEWTKNGSVWYDRICYPVYMGLECTGHGVSWTDDGSNVCTNPFPSLLPEDKADSKAFGLTFQSTHLQLELTVHMKDELHQVLCEKDTECWFTNCTAGPEFFPQSWTRQSFMVTENQCETFCLNGNFTGNIHECWAYEYNMNNCTAYFSETTHYFIHSNHSCLKNGTLRIKQCYEAQYYESKEQALNIADNPPIVYSRIPSTAKELVVFVNLLCRSSMEMKCTNIGGHLLTMKYPHVASSLRDELNWTLLSPDFWVGLNMSNQYGVYLWDGSNDTLTADSWSPWFKNTPGMDEWCKKPCIKAVNDQNIFWKAEYCNVNLHAVCEKNICGDCWFEKIPDVKLESNDIMIKVFSSTVDECKSLCGRAVVELHECWAFSFNDSQCILYTQTHEPANAGIDISSSTGFTFKKKCYRFQYVADVTDYEEHTYVECEASISPDVLPETESTFVAYSSKVEQIKTITFTETVILTFTEEGCTKVVNETTASALTYSQVECPPLSLPVITTTVYVPTARSVITDLSTGDQDSLHTSTETGITTGASGLLPSTNVPRVSVSYISTPPVSSSGLGVTTTAIPHITFPSLKLDIKSLSSYKRRLTCAPDDRRSVEAFGWVTIAFWVVVLLVLLVSDFLNICRARERMRRIAAE